MLTNMLFNLFCPNDRFELLDVIVVPRKVALTNLVLNPFAFMNSTETIDPTRLCASVAIGTDACADLNWSTGLVLSAAVRPQLSLARTTLAVFLDSDAPPFVGRGNPLGAAVHWSRWRIVLRNRDFWVQYDSRERHALNRRRFNPRVGCATVAKYDYDFHTKFFITKVCIASRFVHCVIV